MSYTLFFYMHCLCLWWRSKNASTTCTHDKLCMQVMVNFAALRVRHIFRVHDRIYEPPGVCRHHRYSRILHQVSGASSSEFCNFTLIFYQIDDSVFQVSHNLPFLTYEFHQTSYSGIVWCIRYFFTIKNTKYIIKFNSLS